jgi:hypothetical protein
MKLPISSMTLADELVQRGHLPARHEAMPTMQDDRPWFISIVLGVTGWLAGAFVLACIFLLFKPQGAGGFSLVGLILLSTAFGLYAADRDSEFFDQLALALSIAGQLGLTLAADQATKSTAATAALVTLMQVVLVFAMPNELAKKLAAFFACCAWALTIRFAWWGERRWGSTEEAIALAPALIGWVIVWLPILGTVHLLVVRESSWMAGQLRSVARPALTGLLVALSVATWCSEPFSSMQFWQRAGAAQTNWLVLWPLLGAIVALCASVYAFRLRHRALIGTAIAGALLHVMQFYFLLGTSLLVKSGLMVALGIAALLASARLGKRWELNGAQP